MAARWRALLVWLVIQILTLCFGAMQLPLVARSGSERHHLALDEMIVVQVVVATMLFPMLSGEGQAIGIAVTALPFLQLAGFLAGVTALPLFAISVGIVMWIFGLRLWAGAILSDQNRLMAVGFLNCFVVGGPVLAYLIREFSDSPDVANRGLPLALDPLTALVVQSWAGEILPFTLAAPVLLVVTGAVARAIHRRTSLRVKLST